MNAKDSGSVRLSLGLRLLQEFRFFLLSVGLSALSLAASGCGLQHYDEQVEAEQKRVDYLDQENTYLGAPIKIPITIATPPGTAAPPAPTVSVRLPKEFV